jgi:hypothetical protein
MSRLTGWLALPVAWGRFLSVYLESDHGSCAAADALSYQPESAAFAGCGKLIVILA